METPTRNVRRESSVNNGDDGQSSDYATIGPDPEDNSEDSQRLNTDPAIDLDVSVPVTIQEDFLQKLCDNVSAHFPELSFGMARGVFGATELPVLLITQRVIHFHPPYRMLSRVQVSVQYKRYTIYILMRVLRRASFERVEELAAVCQMIGNNSNHKFCPGIEMEHYISEYYESIRYHIKSVRVTEFPFKRVDSKNCQLFFELSQNASIAEKDTKVVRCYACKRLVTDLNHQKKRTIAETPTRKIKRQNPSSRAKLSYMSPASQAKRKKLAQYERTSNIRKLTNLEEEISLDDEQHEEMCNVVQRIGDVELDKLCEEGDKHGVGSIMKGIWITDKDRRNKEFFDDQATNSHGGRGNRWNMITIRMALAIYTRSPAAYEALKEFQVLKLPSKATLQAFSGSFIHEPGASTVCIADQVGRYLAFKEECKRLGKQEPKGDGALIFDEVKVACQLMWNSRNHKLMGLAMTSKDLASLNDVYSLLQDPEAKKQTSYILQFLWRDLTSEYDIVGPYFTCSSTVEGKFVLACVLETVKLFQCHGLKTSVLMCDGGSSNIAAIKATHGCQGAYSLNKSKTDKHEVEPWMLNPFNPPHKIFWLICPSHQLKNMINALFSSRPLGSKLFQRPDKCRFGWQTIDELYKRELSRVSNGLARMVPRLRESHCLRDAWTKLNVHPAKIMQQEQVLGELQWYIQQHPKPDDADTTSEVLKYLEACNLLFEQGFLSHSRIRSLDSQVLKNIDQGFSYFAEWLNSILAKDPKFPHTSSTQKSFLSWQTWDLLRIDVYGFKAFCIWFLQTYPTYFIAPLRLSGSAVESLFSQYKHNSGGKLDSVNYTTARAAHLVKQSVSEHHSGKGYRDETLNIFEIPLCKKTYNKCTHTCTLGNSYTALCLH